MAKNSMKYETIKPKNNIKEATKAEVIQYMNTQSTGFILWYLAKKHKFGLAASWATIITLLYVFPFLPSLIASLLRIQ